MEIVSFGKYQIQPFHSLLFCMYIYNHYITDNSQQGYITVVELLGMAEFPGLTQSDSVPHGEQVDRRGLEAPAG